MANANKITDSEAAAHLSSLYPMLLEYLF